MALLKSDGRVVVLVRWLVLVGLGATASCGGDVELIPPFVVLSGEFVLSSEGRAILEDAADNQPGLVAFDLFGLTIPRSSGDPEPDEFVLCRRDEPAVRTSFFRTFIDVPPASGPTVEFMYAGVVGDAGETTDLLLGLAYTSPPVPIIYGLATIDVRDEVASCRSDGSCPDLWMEPCADWYGEGFLENEMCFGNLTLELDTPVQLDRFFSNDDCE